MYATLPVHRGVYPPHEESAPLLAWWRAEQVGTAGAVQRSPSTSAELNLQGPARRFRENMMDHTTELLSTYASRLAYQDLPPEVVHQVKRTMIDTFGCALGAFSAEP